MYFHQLFGLLIQFFLVKIPSVILKWVIITTIHVRTIDPILFDRQNALLFWDESLSLQNLSGLLISFFFFEISSVVLKLVIITTRLFRTIDPILFFIKISSIIFRCIILISRFLWFSKLIYCLRTHPGIWNKFGIIPKVLRISDHTILYSLSVATTFQDIYSMAFFRYMVKDWYVALRKVKFHCASQCFRNKIALNLYW